MWGLRSLLLFLSVTDYCRPGIIDNICSSRHGKRVFAGLGESGILSAYNVVENNGSRSGFFEGCRAEIVTCPSCVVSLTFTYMNLSCHCGSGLCGMLCRSCRSDYVWVSEFSYEGASGVSFCGVHPGSSRHPKVLEYKSKSRAVRVSLFYSRSHIHAFTVDYKSEPNRQVFIGTYEYSSGGNLSEGFFSSPFFPAPYPPDIVVEYVFLCKRHSLASSADEDFSCRIHLMFTDFQLAQSSVLEFYEGSRRVYSMSGTSFAPPVIISSTNLVTARFFAFGQTDVGFRAFFSFVSESVAKEMAKPETDCGGFVDSFGGTITMRNMTDSNVKLYHCIWLVQPGTGLPSLLYLRVTAFFDFAGHAELQIRRGLTSESPLLESLRYPTSHNFPQHIIPLRSGAYVRLRAFFGPSSHFAIAYAAFSFNNCFGRSEFLCENFRCISRGLTCDGSDHCGDNSDESGPCYPGGFSQPGGRKWGPRSFEYYFPKAKELSGSGVLLLSFTGLVCLLLVLTTVVYRSATKRRSEGILEDQLQAMSDLRDEASVENVIIDDPPSYDPPPNYEDVMKMAATGNESQSKAEE